jgi:hypothetical protein
LFDRISIESGEKIPLPHEVRQWRDMLKESVRIQQIRDIYGIRAVDEIRNDLNIS